MVKYAESSGAGIPILANAAPSAAGPIRKCLLETVHDKGEAQRYTENQGANRFSYFILHNYKVVR